MWSLSLACGKKLCAVKLLLIALGHASHDCPEACLASSFLSLRTLPFHYQPIDFASDTQAVSQHALFFICLVVIASDLPCQAVSQPCQAVSQPRHAVYFSAVVLLQIQCFLFNSHCWIATSMSHVVACIPFLFRECSQSSITPRTASNACSWSSSCTSPYSFSSCTLPIFQKHAFLHPSRCLSFSL